MTGPTGPLDTLSQLVSGLNPARPLRLVRRLIRRSMKKPGMPPGTIVHTGERRVTEVRIHAMRYDSAGLREENWEALPSEVEVPAPGTGVLWIDMDGLHDVALLERFGSALRLHPLVLEDVANVGQRTKLEEYDEYLFIVLHMLKMEGEPVRVVDEQVSLVVGRGFLCTFQETHGDVFGPVRDRLRQGKQRIREGGSDYLAYALIDALVDSHFQVLEHLANEAERLEIEVLESPSRATVEAIHHLKRELLLVRRAIWPLRDLMSSFLRCEGGILAGSTKVFLRDVQDHSHQLIDTVEILRDLATGMHDLYLSHVSHRTNEVMKVLTVMASVFIPLTFVVGVYGMNFEYMPELGWRWGYPAVLSFMGAMTIGMLVYFRRKDWI